MEFRWIDGFEIKVDVNDNIAVISANREGLLSLADHLKTLAEQEPGYHFHLDDNNSLENGSAELIIELAEGAK